MAEIKTSQESIAQQAHPMAHFLKHHFREVILVVLCVVEIALFATIEPRFLSLSNLLDATRYMAELGLIALAMSLVVRTGGIDLSVGSILAIVSVGIGLFHQAGLPIGVCLLLGLVIGTVCGAINGMLIAYLGLVPLAVTLATMALFRGIAYGLSDARSYSAFPLSFAKLASIKIGMVPAQFLFFLVVVALIWLLMHRSRFGRYVGSVGYNSVASSYSGVRVKRVLLWVYTLSGLLCSMAAVLYTSRVFSSRADAAVGIELNAITAVVLGGASIMGGRGSVIGTLLAVVALVYLQNGLIISGIPGEVQGVVLGIALLIGIFFTMNIERRQNKSR